MKIFLSLLLLGSVALASIKIYDAANETPRGTAFRQITTGAMVLDEHAKPIAPLLAAAYSEYRDNTKRWSLVYYFCMFGAAVFSAMAGLILKLEHFITTDQLKKDLAACLAVVAALLAAISTSGNFHEKWQANRLASAQVEALAFDLLKHPFTPKDEQAMYAALRELTLQRHVAIASQEPEKTEGKQGDSETK